MIHRRCFVLIIALFAVASPALAQTTRPWTSWHNSLAPRGASSAPLLLVRDGRPLYSIDLSEQPTGPEKKAAADLIHWIKEISGAELPVISAAAPRTPCIRIRTEPAFAADEYAIAVDASNDILLTGARGRGVVNAVYALLEEDLGCRFYTNSSIRLPPHAATLSIQVVPRDYAPQLKLRDPFFKVSFDPVWSLRNRTSAPDAPVPEDFGGHIDYGGLFAHTHHTLLPPETYFKEHPEYYQQNPDGKRVPLQLCTTNPQVRKLVTAAVLKVLRDHPQTEVVSVSRLDLQQVCHCPDCEKLRAAEGSEMANQLLLVNEVAEAVAKEHPAVVVDTLAYLETLAVPKTMRPRKNVVIRLCNDVPGAWSHPFTAAERLPVAEITRQWSAVHDRLSVWDYHVNFSHYLAPMPNLDVIAANIRFWTANHAWGVMTQAGYQGAAERDELKSWVIAHLLWDPRRDENELAQDFIWGHYGPAAPAIDEYERLLAQAEKDPQLAAPPGGIRYPMDVSFLSKDFIAQASEILLEPSSWRGPTRSSSIASNAPSFRSCT